jgi:hypothetical protein
LRRFRQIVCPIDKRNELFLFFAKNTLFIKY